MKKNAIAIAITVTIVAILAIFIADLFDDQAAEYKAKLSMQEQESNKVINELAEISNKQSDIELLGEAANIAATNAKDGLDHIEKLRAEIKSEEKEYEFQLLTQRCFESQIFRMTSNLEYNLEYCKDKANLEQFRTKKY